MFSQTVEYALRAAMHLASVSPGRCTTGELAQATQVPPAYLSKVLQSLSRAGVVHTQRGIGGGVALVAKPEEVSIYDVVSAIEPVQRIVSCPLGLPAHDNLCPLHQKLDHTLADVERAFRETTLADLLKAGGKLKPLCAENSG